MALRLFKGSGSRPSYFRGRCSILWLLFFILLASEGKAQIERWRTLGLEEGLPQVQVYDIAQDPGGWIWVGTHGGVSRFDGSAFRNFSQRDGLEDNHTSCILPLGPNEVFVGHDYSASFTYLRNDSVQPVNELPDEFEGSANDLIQKEGRIFAASTQGLLVFEKEGDSLWVTSHIDTAQGLGSESLQRFFDPGNGELWVIHEEGVARVDPTVSDSSMYIGSISLGERERPIQFHLGPEKELFVLTPYAILHYAGVEAYPQAAPKDSLPIPEEHHPNNFVQKNGAFWVGTHDNGIHRILPDRRIAYGKTEGLPNEQITSLHVSHAGNVWVGTDQGLVHSTDLAFQFINSSNGLEDPIVWAIEPGGKKDLWVGTEGGLDHLRFRSSRLQKLQESQHYGEEQGIGMITALHMDQHDRLWLANYSDEVEVRVLSSTDGEVLHKWNVDDRGLPITIESRANGNVLIAGRNENILECEVDTNTGEIQGPSLFRPDNEEFPTQIWELKKDSRGRTWVGSNGDGTGYFKNDKYHPLSEEEGFPHPRPSSITEDERGDMWFGTIGGGVIHYDGEAYDSITIQDGLSANNPFFVQADKRGHIWVGTSNGVDRIRIADREVTRFGREKGLVGMETNQNARTALQNGSLWFGTIKGLIRCVPDRLEKDSIPPRLHLQRVKVASEFRELRAEGLHLDYDENRLRFEFIGVHPDDPGKIAYKYRLMGLPDPQWSAITEKKKITFNHLPPGKYEFQVKARNSDGVWTPEPLSYSFTIEPPFWRTTWFYSSSGILAVFLVLLILRLRTRSLVRQQKRLEHEVSARTQELEKEKKRIEEINQDLEEKKGEAEHQKELVESKNKEITDSLRYAKRIQKALLKEEKRVSEHLPPHFVLFKPREHVSGDFYWALEKEGYLYVTVADCTGHGVPGAFMSMLGTAFLNEICAPEGAKGPARILHELRSKVVKELTQDSDEDELKDGMDISMLRIHLQSREVAWAGANNPLIRVMPMDKMEGEASLCSKDGERGMLEYRPDRKPIGLSDDDTRFSEHRFTPEEGEILYLYSDGFPDQFGGERGKKYKSKNFKQLLLDVAAKSMDEQREAMDKEFESWRGEQEQIDDVCVLGIAPGEGTH